MVSLLGQIHWLVRLQGQYAQFQLPHPLGQSPQAIEEGTSVLEVVGHKAAFGIQSGAVALIGYLVEEEVRLLYEMNDGSLLDTTNGKWIYNTSNGIIAPIVRFPITKVDSRFPLVLERIVLGPNLKERGINKEQLLLMLKYGQIKVADDFEITFTDINSYR